MTTTTIVPRQRADIILTTEARPAILVDRQERRQHALNETALALWQLCDGSTSVDEMVSAISLLFDLPLETIEQDVNAALATMTDLGVIVWDVLVDDPVSSGPGS